MYERARAGRIKPDDIRGATFTISNMGPFGVKDFTAIISAPEAGILAVSSSQRVPVVQADGSAGRWHAHEYDAERRSPRQQRGRGRAIHEPPARADREPAAPAGFERGVDGERETTHAARNRPRTGQSTPRRSQRLYVL